MWANTAAEGGLVAVGVSDDGQFTGCLNIETAHINRLEKGAHDMCPDAHVECRHIDVQRDKDGADDFVLLFRVHYNEHRVVHTVRNRAYIRRGESKHRLTPDEVVDLRNDKREVSIEQQLYPQYIFPDHFDAELVSEFVKGVRASVDDPDSLGVTPEELFQIRRLGKFKDDVFVPNGACVLLFALDPLETFPGCKVRFLRFEGDAEGTGTEWNAVKDTTLEGNIPRLIEWIKQILTSQLREFSHLGPDNRFYRAPEYPQAAWYEAIVNACVHRSYGALKNAPVFVKMFDSRLEVQSPGPFPPSVTPENIYITHSPRNPHLMSAMWFLDFVKCVAEGTRRMRSLMQKNELPPPEFVQKEINHSVVRVTFRNDKRQRQTWIDSAASAIISPAIDKTLTEPERRVINHIAEHGTINASQAARVTGKGWKSAHKILLKLTTSGILRHHHREDIKRDPKAHFVLTPTARQNGRAYTDQG